jgi:hypothetical protein
LQVTAFTTVGPIAGVQVFMDGAALAVPSSSLFEGNFLGARATVAGQALVAPAAGVRTFTLVGTLLSAATAAYTINAQHTTLTAQLF